MTTALIGFTGYVGSCLLRDAAWSDCYRSTNIADIRGRRYDRIVCAGIQAKKWWANQQPEDDLAGINQLLRALEQTQAGEFIMISTVDVYGDPAGVDEATVISRTGLHPYGLHRLMAEDAVQAHFPCCRIVRLPGLFGPGLRKNLIFDMLHRRELPQLDASTVYQYYNTGRLAADLETISQAGVDLINLATAPVPTERLIREVFPEYPVEDRGAAVAYDMRTRHAGVFGRSGHYMQSADEVVGEIKAFVTAERASL